MKKRVIAFLTAVMCVTSAATMSVSAAGERTTEYFEGEDGRLCYKVNEATEALYVKTDGTEPSEEMVTALGATGLTSVCTVAESISTNELFLTNVPDGLDSDGYIIELSYNMTDEEIANLARKMMVQVDFVEDVQILGSEVVYSELTPNFEFYTERVSEDTAVDLSTIPELSPYFEYSDSGLDHPNNCSGTLMQVDDLFMDKFYEDTQADPYDGIFTYAEYEYLEDFSNSIQEKYSDVFSMVIPSILIAYVGVEENYVYSAWTDAGDNNSDGNVTAEDAAGMLTLAAQIGTGADIKATSANDVNADGTVNAEDAAAVLAYAAANGSGNEVSWVDILRR